MEGFGDVREGAIVVSLCVSSSREMGFMVAGISLAPPWRRGAARLTMRLMDLTCRYSIIFSVLRYSVGEEIMSELKCQGEFLRFPSSVESIKSTQIWETYCNV